MHIHNSNLPWWFHARTKTSVSCKNKMLLLATKGNTFTKCTRIMMSVYYKIDYLFQQRAVHVYSIFGWGRAAIGEIIPLCKIQIHWNWLCKAHTISLEHNCSQRWNSKHLKKFSSIQSNEREFSLSSSVYVKELIELLNRRKRHSKVIGIHQPIWNVNDLLVSNAPDRNKT